MQVLRIQPLNRPLPLGRPSAWTGDALHLTELINCQGKQCLGESTNLLCEPCAYYVELTEGIPVGLCHGCYNLWLQDFRGRPQDVSMEAAPHPTGDVPMSDAGPEAAASCAPRDVTMTNAVPAAAAAPANAWAAIMSEDEQSLPGDGRKSRAEQEREAAPGKRSSC